MEKDRKKSIDNLVNELKSKYNVKSLDGLKQLAKDKEIYVIENNEIPVPCAVLLKNEERYIFLKKDSLFKHLDLAHEIGHHLLSNCNKFCKETEANYFEKQITGKRIPFSSYNPSNDTYYINIPFLANLLPTCFFFPFIKKRCLKIIKNYQEQNGKNNNNIKSI